MRVSGDNVIIRTLILDNKDNTSELSSKIDEIVFGLYEDVIADSSSKDNSRVYKLYSDNELPADSEETPSAREWDEDAADVIENALAELDAETLSVSVSDDKTEISVEFEAISAVSRSRTAITEAMTELFDCTDKVSETVDSKIGELFGNAVLSDDSTVNSKVYTAEDYVWSDDDVATVTEALEAAEIAGLSVSADDGELSVSFDKVSDASWLTTDTVSAEISAGLRNSAVLATVAAVVLMLIYIAFRFQISSAFAAIVCLAHDLFVMIVAYSLFQIPVNSTIIAALLTILGYSINATIIIFDRIREDNKKLADISGFADKVDNGIRATLTRSLNTTLTTLFTIGMIYILGVTSIKNFALPLIVGIVAGLFSSVCLAGPLWNIFKKLGKKIKK